MRRAFFLCVALLTAEACSSFSGDQPGDPQPSPTDGGIEGSTDATTGTDSGVDSGLPTFACAPGTELICDGFETSGFTSWTAVPSDPDAGTSELSVDPLVVYAGTQSLRIDAPQSMRGRSKHLEKSFTFTGATSFLLDFWFKASNNQEPYASLVTIAVGASGDFFNLRIQDNQITLVVPNAPDALTHTRMVDLPGSFLSVPVDKFEHFVLEVFWESQTASFSRNDVKAPTISFDAFLDGPKLNVGGKVEVLVDTAESPRATNLRTWFDNFALTQKL